MSNPVVQKTASDNEALEEVKKKLRVAILSGSTGDNPEELSRSRALAETYRDYLTSHGAEVDWMDMRDMGDMPDTYDWDTEWYDDYQKRLTNADAMVVSTPIFQYGPSGKVLQFLHRTLDKENQQFKPYSLLSGAGSPRSALALGGLANQLDTEIKGIGIGGGVQVAGDEFNVETGEMDPGIVSRANENAAKLLQVAGALRQSKTAQTKESRAFMRKAWGALGKTNLGEGLNYVAHHPTTSKIVKDVGKGTRGGVRKTTEIIRGSPAAAKKVYYDPRLSRFSQRVQGVHNNPAGDQLVGSTIDPVSIAGEILSKMGSSPNHQSPLIRAYLIGKKLAHADFNDNDNVEDGLNTHDNEVYHKVKAEDFVSPEDHGNMTPNTNDHSYGQTKNDEVVPEEEEGSIYQTTKIERRERHG